jgi:hypothetical protein
LASLIGSPSDERLAKLAAPSLDAAGIRRAIGAARLSYGSCRVGETLGGDGKSHARVRLDCERAPLELTFATDEQGKVREASFLSASSGRACLDLARGSLGELLSDPPTSLPRPDGFRRRTP